MVQDNTPKYSANFGDKADSYLCDAGNYGHLIAEKGQKSEIKNIGVCGVEDCIGIVAFNPKSGISYVHHVLNPGYDYNGETMLSFCTESLKSINKEITQFNFTIITHQPQKNEKAFNKIINFLTKKGVKNIAIDTGTDKVLMSRETGEICKDFTPKRTSFVSEEEKAREKKELEIREEIEAKREKFLSQDPKSQFENLPQRGLVKIDKKVLIITLGNNYLEYMPKKLFQNIISYGQENNIDSLKINLLPPRTSFTYQDRVTDIVECLKDVTEIKNLYIEPNNNQVKQSFFSDKAIETAEALETSGQHLSHISIAANSRGAEAFANAFKHLQEQGGELKTFELEPIGKEWKEEAQKDINKILGTENLREKNLPEEKMDFSNISNLTKMPDSITHPPSSENIISTEFSVILNPVRGEGNPDQNGR